MGRGQKQTGRKDGAPLAHVGWLRKRFLVEGGRAAYRMLLARDMRLVSADFTSEEPFLMVFARGERAGQLRQLVEQGTVAIDDPARPNAPGEDRLFARGEVEPRDRTDIEMAAASALRLMRKQGKKLFLLEFADEAEPMLTVYARGELATSLERTLAAVGLVYRADAAAP